MWERGSVVESIQVLHGEVGIEASREEGEVGVLIKREGVVGDFLLPHLFSVFTGR